MSEAKTTSAKHIPGFRTGELISWFSEYWTGDKLNTKLKIAKIVQEVSAWSNSSSQLLFVHVQLFRQSLTGSPSMSKFKRSTQTLSGRDALTTQTKWEWNWNKNTCWASAELRIHWSSKNGTCLVYIYMYDVCRFNTWTCVDYGCQPATRAVQVNFQDCMQSRCNIIDYTKNLSWLSCWATFNLTIKHRDHHRLCPLMSLLHVLASLQV